MKAFYKLRCYIPSKENMFRKELAFESPIGASDMDFIEKIYKMYSGYSVFNYMILGYCIALKIFDFDPYESYYFELVKDD